MITTSHFEKSEKPIEKLIPIRSFTYAQSQLPSLPTKAQNKLRELGQTTFIPFTAPSDDGLSERNVQKLNDSFHWQIARINALLNTVLANNVVTDKDEKQLRKCTKNLDALQENLKQLKNNHQLTSKQLKGALNLLEQAHETIQDTHDLLENLNDYNQEGTVFDDCSDSIIEECYDPNNGDPLLSMQKMREAVISLGNMSRIIQPLLNGKGTSSEKLINLFDADLRHFSWIFEDWADSLERANHTLLKDLSKLDSSEAIQQYDAFDRHLEKMQKEAAQIKKELQNTMTLLEAPIHKQMKKDFKSLSSSLDQAQRKLDSVKVETAEKLEELQKKSPKADFSPIEYGDDDWHELATKHTSRQPPSWLMKKIQDVTNVQDWSDTTKDVVYRLFTLMQLDPVSKISGAYDLLSGDYKANLRKMADILQEQAFRDIPEQKMKDIEYETATLGTLLMFNYKMIQRPKVLERLTHKCPSIRQTLRTIMDQFGTTSPSQDQVRDFVDSYRMERLLKESSLSRSYFEQASTFERSPAKKADDRPSDSLALQVVKKETKPLTSAASSQGGLIPTLLKKIKAFHTALSWSNDAQKKKASSENIVGRIHQQTYDGLKDAIARLGIIEGDLQTIQSPDLDILHEESALLHRELFKAIANAPSETHQWMELANWTQHVEDQIFALEALEGQFLSATKELENKARTIEQSQAILEFDEKTLLKGIDALEKQVEQLENTDHKINQLKRQLEAISPSLSHQPELEKFARKSNELLEQLKECQQTTPNKNTPISQSYEWLKKFKSHQAEVQRFIKSFEKLNWSSQVEALDVLKKTIEGERISVSHKLLLHALGDYFGKNTNLEGDTRESALDYRIEMLNRKIKALSSDPQPLQSLFEWSGIMMEKGFFPDENKLLKQLKLALSLYNKFYHYETKNFAESLKSALEGLKPGEVLFLPGGWSGKREGHGLYYEWMKQEDKRYTFRIYNTGAGVETFHPKETIHLQEKYLTFIERKNITLDSILSLPILKAMQEMLSYPLEKEDEWSPADTYNVILEELGGDPSKIIYSQEDLQSPQRAGTCSFMSLTTTLSHHMKKLPFSKAQFEMKLKALVDYSETTFPTDKFDERSFRLLSKTIEDFSRETLEYHAAGIVNDLEFFYASEKIKGIRQLLRTAEQNYLSQIDAAAPLVSFEPVPHPLIENLVEVTPVKNSGLFTFSIPPRHILDVTQWNPSPKTLHEDLSQFQQKLEVARQDRNYKFALIGSYDVINRLSLEWTDHEGNDLWKQISFEQGQSLVHSLKEISHIAFDSFLKEISNDPSRRRELDPQHYLAHLKSLTLAHKLASQFPPESSLPMTFFQDPQILKVITQGRELFLRFYDPKSDHELQQLRQYWDDFKQQHFIEYVGDPEFMSISTNPAKAFDQGFSTMQVSEKEHLSDKARGELFWIGEQLKQPKIYRKLKARIPGFVDMPQNIQKAAAYADRVEEVAAPPESILDFIIQKVFTEDSYSLTRDVLPQSFYDLRDMFFMGSYMLNSPLVAPSEECMAKNERLELIYKVKVDADYKRADFMTFLAGMPTDAERSYRSSITPGLHFENAHRQFSHSDLEKLSKKGKATPNESILWDSKGLSVDLNLDSLRNLLAMTSIGAKLQVKETITYFIKHFNLLEDPNYQTLFDIFLFDPYLLLGELQKLPEEDSQQFIETFTGFIKKNFNLFADLGKIETASYFLSLNERFKHYISYAKKQFNLGKGAFLDTRAFAKQLLNESHLTPLAKSRLSHAIILSYKNQSTIQEEEAIGLLSAAINYKTQFLPVHLIERQNEIEIEKILLKFNPQIEKYFSGDHRDVFLNQIIINTHSQLDHDLNQLTWKTYPAFPIFTSNNGQYVVDLQEAKIYENLGARASLPLRILKNPKFENIFLKPPPNIFQFSLNVYQLMDEQGALFRLILTDKDLVIQRLFAQHGQERWYQYVDSNDIRLDKKALKLNYLHWYSEDPQPEILVTSRESRDPLYRIEFQKRSDYKIPETVHRLDSLGNDSELILANTETVPYKSPQSPLEILFEPEPLFTPMFEKPSSLSFFSRFEDMSLVLVWKEAQTHNPMLIELPRFNLSFKIKTVAGELRAVCKNFPGYFLAKKQHVPALKDFPHFLLLENAKGDQKILLPKQLLKKIDGSSSLETNQTIPERNLNNPEQQFLEYSIDKKTGNLIPNSEEGRLHYSMILLWKMDYAKAVDYLSKTAGFISSYSAKEIEILLSIINHHKENDPDPRAIAVGLHAFYLLVKNADIKAIEFDHSLLSKMYAEYLEVLHQTDPVRLRIEEELLLLEKINPKTQAMLNRWRVLNPNKPIPIGSEELTPVVHSKEEKAPFKPIPEIGEKYLHPEIPILFELIKNIGTFWIKKTIPFQIITSPYILRSSLIENFYYYYQMAKGDPGAFNRYYSQLTSLYTLPEGEENQKKDLLTVFRMIQKTAKPESRTIAAILEAVVKHPDQFPTSDELKEVLDNYESSRGSFSNFFQEKLLKPIQSSNSEFKNKTIYTSTFVPSDTTQKIEVTPQKKEKLQQLQLPYELCVALYKPSSLMSSPIENLDAYVQQVSPYHSLEASTSVQDELSLVFDQKVSSRLPKSEFKSVQNSLEVLKKMQTDSNTRYHITDFQKLGTLRYQLNHQISEGQDLLSEKETILLQKANKPPSPVIEHTKQHLQEVTQETQPITLDHLIYLFLQHDMALFYKANPNLSPDEISTLTHEIMDYLIQSTHLQHLQRLSNQIQAIQEAETSGVNEDELSLIIQEFVKSASTTRTYKVEEHPSYLVFEHYMGILMRPDQVQILDLLQFNEGQIGNPKMLGKVVEMIMGAGKTSVLLPILLNMIADGDHLAMAILPEALMPSMSKELMNRLGPSFNQKIHVIEFERDIPNLTEKLERTLSQLNSITENREALLMTSSSIQSLYLKFVETLFEYTHASAVDSIESLEHEIRLFREIFNFFKEKGWLIIDEADLILNARKEHHFTLGMPIPLQAYNLDLVGAFYQMLGSHTAIINTIIMEFAAQNKGVPFSKQSYREKVVPILIREMLSHQLYSSEPDVKSFLDQLSPTQRHYVETYLSNHKEKTSFEFISQINNPKIKDLLALAKEEIHVLLPLTASKLCDENYGLAPSIKPGDSAPTSGSRTAIPYHGSNAPAIKSQFGNAYEILNYTFQLYLKKGIPQSLIKQEIDILQKQALDLIKRNIPLNETEPYKKFMELCGHQSRFTLFGPESQLTELTAKINESQSLKIHFIKTYIAKEIVQYPFTLSANAQLFNFIVKRLMGFTGTLWNAETFPEGLETFSAAETTAKTLTVLWKNSVDKIYIIPKTHPKEFAESIAQNPSINVKAHALIDTGGLGRGLENVNAARQMLTVLANRVPPINGVVFYDASENLMVLEKDNPVPIPLEHSSLTKEERYTLYDQKHTTGSDIKQAFTAVGLVTISQHTTLRNLLQSVRRMRGLDLGQKIEFVIDQEVRELILTTLETVMGKKVEGELTLAEILLFVAYNQAILKGDNNHRALKQKMKAILQKEVFKVLLDLSVEVKDIPRFFKDVEKLFVTPNPLSTWEMFGNIEQEEESKQVIASEVEALLKSKSFETIENNPQLAQRIDGESLKIEIQNIAQKTLEILPEKLPKGFEGYGIEAEKEAETQQEIEKETEKMDEVSHKVYESKDRISLAVELPIFYAANFFSETAIENIQTAVSQMPETSNTLSDYLREEDFQKYKDDPEWKLTLAYSNFRIYEKTVVKSNIEKLADKISPFVNLNQALSTTPSLNDKEEIFHPAIAGSLNLFQLYQAGHHTAPYQPFDQYQKEVSSFLIVEDKETKKLKFVLLDQNDEQDIKDLLIRDNQIATNTEKQTRVSLYAFNYGSYLQGRERLDFDSIKNQPEFLDVLVQIKFLKGDITYSPEELPHLKQWIKKNNPEKMWSLFQQFCKWKPSALAALPTSDLGDIFKEFGLKI